MEDKKITQISSVLEDFKKLMSTLEFQNRDSIDDEYYWYGEKKIYDNDIGGFLPLPLQFYITVKSVTSAIDDSVVKLRIVLQKNDDVVEIPLVNCLAYFKHIFNHELRKIKIEALLSENK